jgi:hypothetical protein
LIGTEGFTLGSFEENGQRYLCNTKATGIF